MSAFNLVPVVASGFLNQVNDVTPGFPTGWPFGIPPTPMGQLGVVFEFTDFEIANAYNPSVGTLFGGRYQYVQLDSAAGAAIVPGQAVFWKVPATGGQVAESYTVTDNALYSGTEYAMQFAGVCIQASGKWTPGQYSFIDVGGLVNVQYRAALTSTGAVNGPVFVANVLSGADMGLFDVITTAGAATLADVETAIGQYAGRQTQAATNGGLKQIRLTDQRRVF